MQLFHHLLIDVVFQLHLIFQLVELRLYGLQCHFTIGIAEESILLTGFLILLACLRVELLHILQIHSGLFCTIVCNRTLQMLLYRVGDSCSYQRVLVFYLDSYDIRFLVNCAVYLFLYILAYIKLFLCQAERIRLMTFSRLIFCLYHLYQSGNPVCWILVYSQFLVILDIVLIGIALVSLLSCDLDRKQPHEKPRRFHQVRVYLRVEGISRLTYLHVHTYHCSK